MSLQGSKIRYKSYILIICLFFIFLIELGKYIYSGIAYSFLSPHLVNWIVPCLISMIMPLPESVQISTDQDGIIGYKYEKWYKRPTEKVKINFDSSDKAKSIRSPLYDLFDTDYLIYSKEGYFIKISKFYYGFSKAKEIYRKLIGLS